MPENVYIHAMKLGQIETEVLKKLWIQFEEDSDGMAPDSAFQKHSRYRVRQKINQVYSEIVALTKSIKGWFIITLKANYYQYPVPLNCFDISKVYYFYSSTTYEELKLVDEDVIESNFLPGWRTMPSTPEYAFPADWSKMNRKLGVAPPPSVDGTAITLAGTILNRPTAYGPAEAVSGSANPDSGTNVYVDSSGQNFNTLGVIPGLTTLNVSDRSKGVITSVSTTNTAYDTITCSGNLSGGSTNIWTPGDEMRVIGGEYGGFTEIGDVEAEYLLSPTIGYTPLPGVTMAKGNLLVQGFMLPILLTDKNQYPELSPILHQALGIGAAAELCKEQPTDSPEYAQGERYQADYQGKIGMFSNIVGTQYKGDIKLWSRKS